MSELAAYLRARSRADVLALAATDRIGLALALGDEDARVYAAAAGLPLEAARRRLRQARQLGRRASACTRLDAA